MIREGLKYLNGIVGSKSHFLNNFKLTSDKSKLQIDEIFTLEVFDESLVS